MFAIMKTCPQKNSVHRSNGWRRLIRFMVCFVLLLGICGAELVPVSAETEAWATEDHIGTKNISFPSIGYTPTRLSEGTISSSSYILYATARSTESCPSCGETTLNYTTYSETQHYVECDDCGYTWRSGHSFTYTTISGSSCKKGVCSGCNKTTEQHVNAVYTSVNDDTCKMTCSGCHANKIANHAYGMFKAVDGNSCSRKCANCSHVKTYEHLYSDEYDTTCNLCAYARSQCDSCSAATLLYTRFNANQHYVSCDDCGKMWTEAHSYTYTYINGTLCKKGTCIKCGTTNDLHVSAVTYTPINDAVCEKACSSCGQSSTVNHVYRYTYVSPDVCKKKCSNCSRVSNGTHNWMITEYPATATMAARKVQTCSSCWHVDTTYYGLPLSGENPSGGMPNIDLTGNQNSFAWNIYKLMCSIAMPLAIISFASCGFKFLGSIFLGSYVSPSNPDMQKAQKQFLYTVLFVMLIILLPRIFGAAIAFFKTSAWKP